MSICTNVHLYTIIICTDGAALYMCPCMLLVIACALYYWVYLHQLQYAYICGYCKITNNFYVTVLCLIISLHSPSYNIVRCGFCVVVWHFNR